MNIVGLLSLLPIELLPLVFVVGGIAVMLGLLRPGALLALAAVPVILSLLSPLFEEIFGSLSWSIRVLLTGLLALAALRGLLALFIGARATDYAVGRLAYDLIRLPFALAGAIVRGALAILRHRDGL